MADVTKCRDPPIRLRQQGQGQGSPVKNYEIADYINIDVTFKGVRFTHAVFPHNLISAKCENKYWILCGKSEKCETAKFEHISHKNRSSGKNFPMHVEMAKLDF